MRSEYKEREIRFNVLSPIELFIAVDAAVTPPFGNEFKLQDVEMALLKINSNDKKKFFMRYPTTAIVDISLKV